MSKAVNNGPRVTSARVAHIEARIKVHEAKAKKATGQASEARRRAAKGNGPLAWYRRQEAEAMATVAAGHRRQADELRTKLAKAKEQEARRRARQVKRTVATAKDRPTTPGLGQAEPARPTGQPAAKPTKPLDTEEAIRSRRTDTWNRTFPEPLTDARRRFWTLRDGGYTGPIDQDGHPVEDGSAHTYPSIEPRPFDPKTHQPKGHTVAVTGEANTLEQTKASLTELEERFQEDSAAIDGLSSGLASRGLDNLSTSLARIQDAIDAARPAFDDARDQLAKQEAIAEQAQAAGEMADSPEFYGVG